MLQLRKDYHQERREVVSTAVMSLVAKPRFPNYKSKLWWLCLISAIVLMLLFASVYAYASGFGGWISEKLVGRSGVADSNLLIGSSGATGSGLDVAMSGLAVATGAINIYMDGTGTHATLNGNLSTLNGFPSVSVYFQWGYGAVYDHTTAAQTMAGTGAFSADIAHFDPGQTVYYRTVVEADGTSYSSPSTFVTTGSIAAGFNLLNAVVVVAYIALVLFTMVALGRKSTIAALLFMAVAIYIGEAFIAAIQAALNSIF
jgi:hypothetical protein